MLSVIVPVYKTEEYLVRCVDSLICQTFGDIEIILVEDGSPDNCPKLCDELADKYSNVVVIHKENQGLGMARNSGIAIANGEYVAFVDSDDFVEANYFENLYSFASKYDVDVCVSGKIYINGPDGDETYRNCVSEELQGKCILDAKEIGKLTAKVVSPNEYGKDFCSLSVCFSIFKRTLFDNNGLRFVSEKKFLSEDLKFNMALYQECKSVYLSDVCGYHYWYNENSLSRCNMRARFSILISTMEEIEEEFCNYSIVGEEYRVAEYFWANFKKCINQEVRYGIDKKIAIDNMKVMANHTCSQKYLKAISQNKHLKISQKVLCLLIRKKWMSLLFDMLVIYNNFHHLGER